MKGSNGSLVVLPEQIIEIPQNSNLSWLRMFYALPKELVAKRSAYLELPRNIQRVLSSEQYCQMLQSDSFPELVWDCYPRMKKRLPALHQQCREFFTLLKKPRRVRRRTGE